MRVLVINSYAGSLVIAASNLRADIIGSYEDVGFGLPIQQANFPYLNFIAEQRHWPAQDLSDTFVIAHPPCSAFSTLNTSKTARGTDSKAFSCTKKVLDYALGNKAVGLAVESVPGALSGAWWIHQKAAERYGYHVYRILQTGAMFSAQWRDRFWVVFIKKGVARPNLELTLSPRWRTVAQVVQGTEDGPTYDSLDRQLVALKRRFTEDAGCTESEMSRIFDPQDPPHPTCGVNDIFWKMKFPEEDRWETCKKFVGTFSCGQMVFLDPNGLAPTLLGGSWWYLNGRNLSQAAYKRIAGFPDSYVFPSWPRNFEGQARMYMSKGVIPAVAEWVLGQSLQHIGHTPPKLFIYECGCAFRAVKMKYALCPTHGRPHVRPYRIECQPDHIADFRFRKKHWGEVVNPPLRQEDDYATIEKVVKKIGDPIADDDEGMSESCQTLKTSEPSITSLGSITSNVNETSSMTEGCQPYPDRETSLENSSSFA